jgi:hypothetical protein
MSNISYKVSMLGVSLADPYAFLKAVFPQWNGEPAQSDGASVIVTFDTPQTPADLGPLVLVEIYDPSQPRLP